MSDGPWQPPFANRRDAGRTLAERLGHYAGQSDLLALGLPRGGVPVAYEVARALKSPLDVFLVRKLGVPGHEELAMGAIATGNVRWLNPEIIDILRIPASVIEEVTAVEGRELARRAREYRDDRPPPVVAGKTVLLIDDGLATGSTMRAALMALRQQGPARIVVAVPVAAPQVCDEFRDEVDEIVCAVTPARFGAVGSWYEDFSPTSDAEVRDLLRGASAPVSTAPQRPT